MALSALILAETAIGSGRIGASAQTLLIPYLRCVDANPAAMMDRALQVRGRDPTSPAGKSNCSHERPTMFSPTSERGSGRGLDADVAASQASADE